MHDILNRHPCFGAPKGIYGRIHLPIAPKCNISCRYCDKKLSCSNDSYPGLAKKIIYPHEVLDYIKVHDNKENNLQVIGIAGPGEPLYNENTFEILQILKETYPEKIKCLSTNGLLLSKEISRLKMLDVQSITVTINTLNPIIGEKIYKEMNNIGRFLELQQQGAKMVVNNGIFLKINTVLIPEINGNEIRDIAKFAQKIGASIMNIMPLIAHGEFSNMHSPTVDEIEEARVLASCFVSQHTGCEQCRADAIGIPKCGRR